MAHLTLEEIIQLLIEQAKGEKDPAIREQIYSAINKLLDDKIKMKPDNKDLVMVLLFFIVIATIVILSFIFLSPWQAILVIIGIFALACLMMGVILRMRGDLSEGNFIVLVREGFKALRLSKKGNKK